jgi:putative ABC transport system permease protein
LVEHVSPKLQGVHRVESQSIHQRDPSIVPAANISAVEPAYSKIRNLSVAEGAFFALPSAKSTRQLCVLGHSIANKLFDGRAVGNAIYVEDHEFFVTGVLKERGGEIFGLTTDQEIYVPLQTYVSLFGGREREATIYLELVDKALISEGKDQVRSLARVKRGVPPSERGEFTIHERSEVKERVGFVRSVIRRGGYLVAFLNFLAGGICVTSIMYIFAKRQTRQIGIRMSCGAKRRHIAFSFLLESTLICLVGGMTGLVISCGAFVTAAHLSFLQLYVPVYEISLSFLVFVTGGIVFGLLPAVSASRVSPITSIRHE